jgi:Na+-translocating ferredoxin:NAD+ oxidoreductase subunit B
MTQPNGETPKIDPKCDPKIVRVSRRGFFTRCAQGAAVVVLGGGGIAAAAMKMRAARAGKSRTVWQIDPWKCTQCGQCATKCVLKESAAKCVHDMSMCGYCQPCFGYFPPRQEWTDRATPQRYYGFVSLEPGAENEMCPVGAITRKFVETPYYQYTIDEKKCIGCGLCVRGCTSFGNGSLYLQVRHDRCLNCNECSIAKACPSDAFFRAPAERPYVIKSKGPGQLIMTRDQ